MAVTITRLTPAESEMLQEKEPEVFETVAPLQATEFTEVREFVAVPESVMLEEVTTS
ncbi:MAG: hypothetical protein JSR72_23550 [Proteobacteria bacterium]|nr:hypothetical protein [Pseudomonadota bacterium]